MSAAGIYPHMISFRDYTTDTRLLQYDEVLQYIYQNILKNNNVDRTLPAEATMSQLAGFATPAAIKTLLGDSEKFSKFASSANILRWLLCKQYERLGDEWPPVGYPDVKVSEEGIVALPPSYKVVALPPSYKVPGIMTESHLQACIRFIRRICEESTNPNIRGKTLQEVYTYMAALKYTLNMKEDDQYESFLSALEESIQAVKTEIASASQSNITPIQVRLTSLEDKKKQLIKSHNLAELLRPQTYNPIMLATVSADIEQMESYLGGSILVKGRKEFNFYKIVLGNKNFDDMETTFKEWYNTGKIIGLYAFNISDANPGRFYGESIRPTWTQLLDNLVYRSSYTEAFGNVLFGAHLQYIGRKLNNRNQQVFIGFNANVMIDLLNDALLPFLNKLSDCAWIKFNYNGFPKSNKVYYGDNMKGFEKIIQFQGYRLEDLPPPPILKAFAHGPPVDMSPHVKTLFPEWTKPNTLAVWLDSVMAKWRADISKMAAELQQTLCKDGVPNDETWHMRDVPTVQMDLYNDVLAYIATQRGVSVETLRRRFEVEVQKGGSRKNTVQGKEMTRYTRRAKKQRGYNQNGGAATGMPLAYFQDGAQMRGTYAEPTGVGLAGSTNTMARVGISQTGGKQNGGAATSMPLAYFQDGAQMHGTYAEPTGVGLAGSTNTMARVGISQNGGACNCAPGATQNGGFAPSIMGPLVTNGSYLMPVATYMGYKMLRGKRPAVGLFASFKSRKSSRKGSRSAGRTARRTGRAHHKGSRFTHRGPRSSHKKRR